MFKTAISELKVKPEEVIFIDDSIQNIKAAERLGLNAILMVRELDNLKESNIKYINELAQIYL